MNQWSQELLWLLRWSLIFEWLLEPFGDGCILQNGNLPTLLWKKRDAGAHAAAGSGCGIDSEVNDGAGGGVEGGVKFVFAYGGEDHHIALVVCGKAQIACGWADVALIVHTLKVKNVLGKPQ